MTARAALFAWVGLIILLALTVTLAYVPMGVGNLVAALAIAAAKAAIILLVFMKLWRGRALHQIAAGVFGVWIAILVGLTFADYATRPDVAETEVVDLPAPAPAEP